MIDASSRSCPSVDSDHPPSVICLPGISWNRYASSAHGFERISVLGSSIRYKALCTKPAHGQLNLVTFSPYSTKPGYQEIDVCSTPESIRLSCADDLIARMRYAGCAKEFSGPNRAASSSATIRSSPFTPILADCHGALSGQWACLRPVRCWRGLTTGSRTPYLSESDSSRQSPPEALTHRFPPAFHPVDPGEINVLFFTFFVIFLFLLQNYKICII